MNDHLKKSLELSDEISNAMLEIQKQLLEITGLVQEYMNLTIRILEEHEENSRQIFTDEIRSNRLLKPKTISIGKV